MRALPTTLWGNVENFLLHNLTCIDTASCMFKPGASSFYECRRHVALSGKKKEFTNGVLHLIVIFHAIAFPVDSLSTHIAYSIKFPHQSAIERRSLFTVLSQTYVSAPLSPRSFSSHSNSSVMTSQTTFERTMKN